MVSNAIKNYDGIIWDWNGTLLNDVDYAVELINIILKKRQLPALSKDDYRKTFGFPVAEYYKRLGFDFSKEPFEDIAHEYVELYMSSYKNCELFPEAKEWLAEIKSLNKSQAILSATDQKSLDGMMEHYGLHIYLDHAFGIENRLAAGKIHRGHELLKQKSLVNKKILLIGDTDHDLEVGQALGLDVLLVTYGHQCQHKLRSIHHSVY